MSELLLAVEFTVLGTPVPKGSTRSFALKAKPGQRVPTVTVPDNKPALVSWEGNVRALASEQVGGVRLGGALEVEACFIFAHPGSHYGSGRHRDRLLPSAPVEKVTKPDLDKLIRSVLDALTGQVFRDDAQVVRIVAEKRFGEPERLEVRIAER